jgi:GT2 family glycosyltransferase
MGATLLITTLNRPHELRRCVRSIVDQTTRPEEIVIVDASEESQRWPLDDLVRSAAIRLVHIPARRGRTHQLNVGIRASRGDPVIIVDDDAVLDREFVRAMLRAFEDGGQDVGAIQGTMANDTYTPSPFRVLRRLFLLPQHTKRSRGKLLRSGYYTIPVRPAQPIEAEAVRLGATGFRRHVLHQFFLDESLDGYALKEDIDLSYRVSRQYRVLVIPDARFLHLKTPTARIGVREKSRMHVVNNFWFFSKHMRGPIMNDVAFAWSMVGRVGLQMYRTLVTGDPGFVLGTFDGFVDVYRNRRQYMGNGRSKKAA